MKEMKVVGISFESSINAFSFVLILVKHILEKCLLADSLVAIYEHALG